MRVGTRKNEHTHRRTHQNNINVSYRVVVHSSAVVQRGLKHSNSSESTVRTEAQSRATSLFSLPAAAAVLKKRRRRRSLNPPSASGALLSLPLTSQHTHTHSSQQRAKREREQIYLFLLFRVNIHQVAECSKIKLVSESKWRGKGRLRNCKSKRFLICVFFFNDDRFSVWNTIRKPHRAPFRLFALATIN